MSQASVVVVILNTNRRDDTLACLASFEQSTHPVRRAIVLDNASADGSVDAVASAFPQVRAISLTTNRGYAGNNNVGIHEAMAQGADWVLVLNEDTILDPACLERLCSAAEHDPTVGIVGPMVYHHDEPMVIQSAGGLLGHDWSSSHAGQGDRDEGQFASPREVAWISGCALMVRREVIEQVGALDERFFYYWEEVDWCLRAAKRGWRILHVPSARLWHKGVQRDYRPGPSVSYYNTRNRLLLMMKHRAPLGAWMSTGAGLTRTLASLTLKPKWQDRREHRNAIARGAMDFFLRRWGKGSF